MPHTPGPWKAVDAGIGNNPDIIIEAPDFGILADLGGGPVAERWANARLMAAAPDLLAACREFIAYDESNCADDLHSWAKLKDAMVAAIAKAEGK